MCTLRGVSEVSADILTAYARYRPTGMHRRLDRALAALGAEGFHICAVTASPSPRRADWLSVVQIGRSDLSALRNSDHGKPLFWARYAIAASRRCVAIALRDHPRCLLAFGFGAAVPLVFARVLTSVPLLLFTRSDEMTETTLKGVPLPLRLLFAAVQWVACRSASRIIAVNNTVAESLASRYGRTVARKTQVLPNDLPAAPDRHKCRAEVVRLLGNAALSVSICGRIARVKNFRLVLEALARVREDSIRLVIAGDGPDLGSLRESARALSIAHRVVFTGWREDAMEITAGTDLFLLPSFTEGMSNSLLEALAGGVPCMVSRIPAHEELFGGDGPLFSPTDPEELAAMISRFATSQTVRLDIAERCAAVRERLAFDWDRRLVEVVRSVMAARLD